MLRNILAQDAVDFGLIAFSRFEIAAEPIDQVGVEPQRYLLFDGAKQGAASRAFPIALLGYVAGLDLIIGKRSQGVDLGLLLRGQYPRNRLLHKPSFRAASPFWR